MGKEWRFTQLKGEKRELKLTGASAPHGRPRQRPVVADGIELRHSRTYYPGSSKPTTHIFGIKLDDYELEGRFSDVWLGPGGTKSAIRDWQSFVADGVECLISWGDIVNAYGVVTKFIPERESEFEGAYKITIIIDDQIGTVRAVPTAALPVSPLGMCQNLLAAIGLNVDIVPKLPNAGDLHPDFLDSLEDTVASINGFSAALVKVAGDINAFEEATLDQLERLRAGVVQMRTAVNSLRSTVAETENDSALLARAADTDVQWFANRATLDVATTAILALLEALDRETEIARRGRILALHVAKTGDTWESIATQFFGGPEDAGLIRDANGILYGALPIPGRQYQVPMI